VSIGIVTGAQECSKESNDDTNCDKCKNRHSCKTASYIVSCMRQ